MIEVNIYLDNRIIQCTTDFSINELIQKKNSLAGDKTIPIYNNSGKMNGLIDLSKVSCVTRREH